MTTQLIQYIGTSPLSELPYTGRQKSWAPGQIEDTDTVFAALLLSFGVGWANVGVSRGVQFVSAAQIAAPTAVMLADTSATYQLNVQPGTRYQSNGAALLSLGTVISVAHGYSAKQFNCAGRLSGDNVLLETVVIPANTLGPNSLIEVYAMFSFPGAGGNGKDPLIRIGPTSGSFLTALNILNNQNLSTTKVFSAHIRGHNMNSVAANIWTPPQSSGTGNQGVLNAVVSYAVDFSQPVSIYFGGTCNNTYGDGTDIVRLEIFSVTVTK